MGVEVRLSDELGPSTLIDFSQFFSVPQAYLFYYLQKRALFAFDNHDRFLDDIRKEEAERYGVPFVSQSTCLIRHTVHTNEWKTVTLPDELHYCFHCSMVITPFGLFLAGGRFEDQEETVRSPTYLLNTRTFAVQSLHTLPQLNSPTLVYYDQSVYSFGGSVFPKNRTAVSLAVTWKFSLGPNTWTSVDDMPTPHCYGWAERYLSKVFIFGGFGSAGAVDEFSLETEKFRSVAVTLSTRSEAVLGIRDGDTLLLLSGQTVMKLGLTADTERWTLTEETLEQDYVWMWNCSPVVVGRRAFVVLFDLMMFTVDLDTKVVQQSNMKDGK